MDEVKKKNYILINSLGGGGAERQVSYISQLKEIEKIILLEPIISYDIPKEKLIFLSNSPNSILQKAMLLFTISSKLKKIGVDKNANLFCFLQLSYILGLIAKFVIKFKFTVCIRTSPFGFYEKYAGTKIPFFIYKYILRKADKIICNSKTSELQLKEKLNLTHVISVSNGYDIDFLKKESEKSIGDFEPIFSNNKVLITVGRLVNDKAQWHLIRIFNQLKDEHSKIKLCFLGEGEYLGKLIDLCHQHKLKVFDFTQNMKVDNSFDVYFIGFHKNPYSFVRRSYLFLLSSLYEGLPNVAIESLIVETPCVMSDCNSGPREILLPNSNLLEVTYKYEKSDLGFLVKPFNGQEIWNTSNLNNEELIWLNLLNSILYEESTYILFKKNTANIIEGYSIKNMYVNWLNSIQ